MPGVGRIATSWQLPGANPPDQATVSVYPREVFAQGATLSEVRGPVPAAAGLQAAAAAADQGVAKTANVNAADQGDLNAYPAARNWTSYIFKGKAPGGNPQEPSGNGAGNGGNGTNGNGGSGGGGNGGGGGNEGPGGGNGGSGGGGGGNGGGNGGGGGGNGGGGPGGDGNSGWIAEWQLNRKLNIQLVPEWDGHGGTAIEYLCKIAELVRLSPQMVVDLGAIAPLKFTDRAAMWWSTQTLTFRNYVSQSWETLLRAIQVHFLNENWVQERMREWEEMKFRQKGHDNEWPLDYLQRRIRSHMFLFPDQEDGPAVVDRLLRNAPDVWAGTINSERYPDIFSLAAAIRRYCKTLMGNWLQAKKLDNLAYYPRRGAHAVDVSSERGSEKPGEEEDGRSAFVSSGYRFSKGNAGRSRSTPNAAAGSSTRPDSGGKANNSHLFVKRDDVHSDRPPTNGRGCYVCTSMNHLARDCPQYGRWLALRDAHTIEVDVDIVEESEDLKEWLAMFSESNPTVSAYSRESSESSENSENGIFHKEGFMLDAQFTGASALHVKPRSLEENRNARRRNYFDSLKRRKEKNKADETTVVIPRRILRFKNARIKKEATPTSASSTFIPTPDPEPAVRDEKVDSPPLESLHGVRVIKAFKARSLPPGLASLGVSALHLKVHIGDPSAPATKGRLDSGADITLMSEEFFNSLVGLPKPKEGLRMKLYALTGEAKVLGYTRFTMYALAADGVLVSFEVEAYVVRDMRVPLLLGEDFQ
ncbi:hypothetical protein B0H11DRAFT_1710674, partial [Mycena galericulata]